MQRPACGLAKTPSKPAATLPAEKTVALHGRCISGGVGRLSLSSVGKEEEDKKRQNPCQGKGFDAVRRQLSPADKVEAAGIEPASRDIFTKASTCVAEGLIVGRRVVTQQDYSLAYSGTC
jgi:hypothetical protein